MRERAEPEQSKEKQWTIYAYLNRRSGRVAYVGITGRSLTARAREHLRACPPWYRTLMATEGAGGVGEIAEVGGKGEALLAPIVVAVCHIRGTRREAEKAEKTLVRFFLMHGHPLANSKHIPGRDADERAAFISCRWERSGHASAHSGVSYP